MALGMGIMARNFANEWLENEGIGVYVADTGG